MKPGVVFVSVLLGAKAFAPTKPPQRCGLDRCSKNALLLLPSRSLLLLNVKQQGSDLEKYRRRSKLLKEALQEQRTFNWKQANRLVLMEDLVKRLKKENEDIRDVETGNEAEVKEELVAALNKSQMMLVQSEQALELKSELISKLELSKREYEEEIESLRSQIDSSAKASRTELSEIELALFDVEKELKAERSQWETREEDLQDLLQQEKAKVKSLSVKLETLKQMKNEIKSSSSSNLVDSSNKTSSSQGNLVSKDEVEAVRKSLEEALKREKIIENRLVLLQNELKKKNELIDSMDERQNEKEAYWKNKLAALSDDLQASRELVEKYRKEKIDIQQQIVQERLRSSKSEADKYESMFEKQRNSFEIDRQSLESQMNELKLMLESKTTPLQTSDTQPTTDPWWIENNEPDVGSAHNDVLFEADASLEQANLPPEAKLDKRRFFGRIGTFLGNRKSNIKSVFARLLSCSNVSEHKQKEREKSYMKSLRQSSNANVI